MTDIHSFMEALMLSEEHPLRYDPGQIIFKAGDKGTAMYIVRSGNVQLKAGDTILETVGRGGCLGEMALIDPAPRSATAVAGADCTLVGVDETTFHELVKQVPGFALEVMRVMARRLRNSAV